MKSNKVYGLLQYSCKILYFTYTSLYNWLLNGHGGNKKKNYGLMNLSLTENSQKVNKIFWMSHNWFNNWKVINIVLWQNLKLINLTTLLKNLISFSQKILKSQRTFTQFLIVLLWFKTKRSTDLRKMIKLTFYSELCLHSSCNWHSLWPSYFLRNLTLSIGKTPL